MSQRAPLTQRRGFNHIGGTLSTPLSKRVTEHHSLKENCITTGTWNGVFGFATLRFSNVPLVNLLDSLECVNIGDRLVQANPHDAWKPERVTDRKSTRLNSSHTVISYAVFCLKKKRKKKNKI